MEEIRIPILRTIRQEAAATGVPEHFIRRLVKVGKVHAVYSGNRAYVLHDSLVDFLNGEDME